MFFDNTNQTIKIIKPDGSGLATIGQGNRPQISPDGSKIVYSARIATPTCGNLRSDIYVMNSAGTKLSSITNIFVNGSDSNSTYPSDTTWEVPVTLNLGDNNFTIYGSDGTNNTATQTIHVNRHTLGDINGDGNVDLIDASLFAVDWDKTEDLTYLLSDMNDDGNVDLTDLSILAKLEE